jgi:hypothetical protein
MVRVNEGAHSDHVHVNRCDIKPGSVGRFSNVEMGIFCKGNSIRFLISNLRFPFQNLFLRL